MTVVQDNAHDVEWHQLPLTFDGSGTPDTTNPSMSVLLLTVVEAGKLLGVGRTTAYELIGSGDLEVVHIGRAARVPVDSVHAYVARLRTASNRCQHVDITER
jgi:excisionase family DNA binding protein